MTQISGCQVFKFATNQESQAALGLIQTNQHSMPVSKLMCIFAAALPPEFHNGLIPSFAGCLTQSGAESSWVRKRASTEKDAAGYRQRISPNPFKSIYSILSLFSPLLLLHLSCLLLISHLSGCGEHRFDKSPHLQSFWLWDLCSGNIKGKWLIKNSLNFYSCIIFSMLDPKAAYIGWKFCLS